MAAIQDRKVVLVTGGNGFIGSHVASRLYRSGEYRVRIVDIAPKASSFFTEEICDELVVGNLCDPMVCRAVIDGVSFVLHFAANMGGMGTIHEANEFAIYSQNHAMTLTLLEAAMHAGVEHFLYASSACVYPEHLQTSFDPSHPVSLREDDVYALATSGSPPSPQGLYGLEKLATEQLFNLLSAKSMQICIARFHNVYGPGGAWMGGREKAPAALLRKAIALSHLPPGSRRTFEIWGDGTQLRSFIFIDDAVDAVVKLLNREETYRHPLNIGSDRPISILDLSRLALSAVDIDPDSVHFEFTSDRPLGVHCRSSNNERVSKILGWSPSTSLEEGMTKTGVWIKAEMGLATGNMQEAFLHSQVLDLKSEHVSFAILLPITSRGGSSPKTCLEHLSRFAASLSDTTWRDVCPPGSKYRIALYLAIDHDDDFLLSNEPCNKAEAVLRQYGFTAITTLICNVARGHVCELWRECARRAYTDGCDYMGLFGDDVTLKDEGWMRKVDSEFHSISTTQGVPFGIGCVAFTDTSFPGMPTFPIIHRRHLDIFDGTVVPQIFFNQDGDPYLYQLYRRWNASTMIEHRLSNGIGGSDTARYEKQHASDWTFDTLNSGIERVRAHIAATAPNVKPVLTMDVVIPCYRVDLDILDRILSLQHSPTLSVMFIVIVDNPLSPQIATLEQKYGSRPDIRIRVNTRNLGASASRNRGMAESSAEWVHFLDDDVVPNRRLLFEAEDIIRKHPNAAGFVGNTIFPPCKSIFQTAVHIAGVTYFWDIATKISDDVPWGVTANLIARRNIQDDIVYDLRYPKTGGGEDIDFCRLKRKASLARGGVGFVAAPRVEVTHPWWNKGSRSYWRFYMWSYGDGMLVSRFPSLSYRDYAPNSAELLLVSLLLPPILAPFAFVTFITPSVIFKVVMTSFASIIFCNVLHDLYRHLWRHPERYADLDTPIKSGPVLWLAIVESTFVRISSELGRLKGMLDRGEYRCLGKRFDWFTNREGDGPRNEERRHNVERLLITGLFFGLIISVV